jgi:hypothetical protein
MRPANRETPALNQLDTGDLDLVTSVQPHVTQGQYHRRERWTNVELVITGDPSADTDGTESIAL